MKENLAVLSALRECKSFLQFASVSLNVPAPTGSNRTDTGCCNHGYKNAL